MDSLASILRTVRAFARPSVDILKQMMMDGAIMPKIKLALG